MEEGHFSPVLRQRRLAGQLRRLREKAGLTRTAAAQRLHWQPSKITRVEHAESRIHHGDVRDMLDVYQVADERSRGYCVTLARQAAAARWWTAYRGAARCAWYVGLEDEAARVLDYQPFLLPELLRTEEYARAVAATSAAAPREIDEQVAVMLRRQRRLTATGEGLELWAIVDEGTLDRPVGGATAMRRQLERVLELARLANVTIQVVPRAAGAYPGMGTPTVILSFADPLDDDAVYLHGLEDAHLAPPGSVARHRRDFGALASAAAGLADSAELVAAAIERFDAITRAR